VVTRKTRIGNRVLDSESASDGKYGSVILGVSRSALRPLRKNVALGLVNEAVGTLGLVTEAVGTLGLVNEAVGTLGLVNEAVGTLGLVNEAVGTLDLVNEAVGTLGLVTEAAGTVVGLSSIRLKCRMITHV